MHELQSCFCCCIPHLGSADSIVKLLLKGEVGVCALNSPGNYIVDHGKSWKNHGIVFLSSVGTLHVIKGQFYKGVIRK